MFPLVVHSHHTASGWLFLENEMGPIFTFIYISINLIAKGPAGPPRKSMNYALIPEGNSSGRYQQLEGRTNIEVGDMCSESQLLLRVFKDESHYLVKEGQFSGTPSHNLSTSYHLCPGSQFLNTENTWGLCLP